MSPPITSHVASTAGHEPAREITMHFERDNTYILLFTDRFSRRADMFPVTAAVFTAEDTANILVNQYIRLWGCPCTILSDNGLQFCSKLSQAVYQLLGVHNLATSSYHPNCNGGVERVNHTMAQMLDMVVNERQDHWDLHLPDIEFAYNNSVSAATGHGQIPTASSDGFRPHWCRETPESGP